MILTLGDVISRSSSLAGGRLDWSPSEISFYANLSLQELSTRIHYTGKEALAYSSVSSGEGRVQLPSDFDYALTVRLDLYSVGTADDGAGGEISVSTLQYTSQLTLKDPSETDSGSTVFGQPQYYTLYNNWMELVPSPTSGYSITLRYASKQRTLIDSSATPDIDERWHPAWMYNTEKYLRKSRDDQEGSLIAERQYLQYVQSTPTDRSWRQQTKSMEGMRVMRVRTQ
jgi:hypothetical protein